MKKTMVVLLTLMLTFSLTWLVGCGDGGGGSGGKTVTSSVVIGWIPLNVSLTHPDSDSFRWSTDAEDFMSDRQKAILLGPDFKISVDAQTNELGGGFQGFKERRAETYEIHDVEFGGLKGFAYNQGVSVGYNVFLEIPYANLGIPEKTGVLWLQVYADTEDKELLTEKFNSTEVQNILKTVELTATS